MRWEFERILNALEIDSRREPEVESIRQMTLSRCKDRRSAVDLNLELTFNNQVSAYSPKYYALIALCKTIALMEMGLKLSGDPISSVSPLYNEAMLAMREIRSCGNLHNEGVLHWFLGEMHRLQNGNSKVALSEITEAIKLFKACNQRSVLDNKYSCIQLCNAYFALMHWSLALAYQADGSPDLFDKQKIEVEAMLNKYLSSQNKVDPEKLPSANREWILDQLQIVQNEIQAMRAASTPAHPEPASPAPAPSSSKPAEPAAVAEEPPILVYDPAKDFPWQASSLFTNVFDLAHATGFANFVLDDAPVGEMTIDEIKFDGIPHRIFHLRGGYRVNYVPGGNYHWIKVAGTSMNKASPVPLEPDDYILASLDITPNLRDIVIAQFEDPPTPQERAGVVKRYTSRGLRSESTEEVRLIPLDEVKIRGVVIAVAKPVRG